MSSAEAKRLVIDASVATSTGESGQRGERCQAFLRVMIDETYHRLVMTREIGEEWDIHSHPFARRWRRSMNAKRRVDRPNAYHDAAFCLKIERASQTEKALDAMEKDLRLIEAARITDNRVISMDDTARSYFSAVSNQVGELRDILWVNPVNDDESPTKWLTDGAPIEEQRQLRP
jgi:hypothetical protein